MVLGPPKVLLPGCPGGVAKLCHYLAHFSGHDTRVDPTETAKEFQQDVIPQIILWPELCVSSCPEISLHVYLSFCSFAGTTACPPPAFPDQQRPCLVCWGSTSATLGSSESGNQGKARQPTPPARRIAGPPARTSGPSYTITVDQA